MKMISLVSYVLKREKIWTTYFSNAELVEGLGAESINGWE